jgi:hypothetical protein
LTWNEKLKEKNNFALFFRILVALKKAGGVDSFEKG